MSNLVYRHWHEGMNPRECISVDGNAPGHINLSHWPGNRTPEEFRHDLSTGSALMFSKAANREALLEGISTVTNNHFDTDGVCSAWAVMNPGLSTVHGHALIAAAMAGDFAVFTTPEGVKIDLTLTALAKNSNSPVYSGKYGTELECRGAQYEHALEMLPRLLDNPDLHADWFAREFWTIQKDMRALREDDTSIEKHEAIDFAVVRHDRLLHPMAVNTLVDADRILTCTSVEKLHFFELRLTTRSWFELKSRPFVPRKNWSVLADMLNDSFPDTAGHWRAEDINDPMPRLQFLDEDDQAVPSASDPAQIAALIARFFRSSLAGA